MPKQYFDAIYKNPNVTSFIQRALKQNLKPFSDYLSKVIDEQVKRQVETKWEKIESNFYKIVPQFTIIKIESNQTIEIDISDWYFLECSLDCTDLIGEKIVNEDFSKIFSIINISSNDSLTCVRLSLKPSIHDNYYIKRTTSIYFKEITEIQSIKINSEEIKDFQYKNGKISFNSTCDFSNHPKIIINNIIPILKYDVKDNSSNVLYQKNQKINIISKKDNIIITKDITTNDIICDAQGNNVKFQVMNISVPKILYDSESQPYEFNSTSQGLFSLMSHDDIGENEFLFHDGLMYKIFKSDGSDSRSLKIRLIDEFKDDENSAIKSPIDYFFEEGVRELVDKPMYPTEKYEIIEPKNNERKILTLRHATKGRRISFEELPKILYLQSNPYQNKMQKFAVDELMNRPVLEHRKLLLLSENIDKTWYEWESFIPDKINEWHVLKDETREGNDTQRRFVEKAISTPDFAFLEGPPGSGKTTAILELILQLLKQGKRILLSASTHVAIDNVLERIMEYKDEFNIRPLRIGQEGNVYNENLKKYILSNLINDSDENEFLDVFLRSANLVCGTTIGILQHPHLKRAKRSEFEPVSAEFDYLIIDESSKTTYQEFLITAIRAKKWVLVGDIKQLPPYTEDFDLIQNFNSAIGNQGSANLILGTLLTENAYERDRDYKVCIVLTKLDYILLKEEVIERKRRNPDITKHLKFMFLDNRMNKDDFLQEYTINFISSTFVLDILKVHGTNILFINEEDYENHSSDIPSNFTIIQMNNAQIKSSTILTQKYRNDYFHKLSFLSDKTQNQIDNLKNATSKSWAENIVWKLKRNFELRFSKDNIDREKYIEPYLPNRKKEEFLQKYEMLYQIALPSILESLQKGVKYKKDQTHVFPTILNQGFPSSIFQMRHEILQFQHRMHPEISEFSRNQFYDCNALKDSDFVKNREDWNYKRYQKKSIWLDVKYNLKRNRNDNINEVQTTISELRKFLEWSKENPKIVEGKVIPYEIACLTFYKAQERLLREELRKFPKQGDRTSHFVLKDFNSIVVLQTVDKFQGREADITFISMVKHSPQYTVGFLDSVNRLNVAMTRARYQRVIIGDWLFFKRYTKSSALSYLAEHTFREEVMA